MIQQWLMSDGHNIPDECFGTHSPQILYTLVTDIADIITGVADSWSDLHQLPSSIASLDTNNSLNDISCDDVLRRYQVYATALTTISQWPSNFRRFLAKYATKDGSYLGSLRKDFDIILIRYIQYRWTHYAFAFVQAAFRQFLERDYPPSTSVVHFGQRRPNTVFANTRPYVTLKEAANIAKCDPCVIKRSARAGLVEVYAVQTHVDHNHVFYTRTDVSTLADLHPIALRDVAQQLLVSRKTVEGLVDRGLLTVISDIGSSSCWILSRESLDHMLGVINSNVECRESVLDTTIDFSDFLESTRIPDLSASEILERLYTGQLTAYCEHAVLSTDDLGFAPESIIADIEAVKYDQNWVNVSDVAASMNISVEAVDYLCTNIRIRYAAVVILPYEHRILWLRSRDAERLRRAYVSTPELADITGASFDEIRTCLNECYYTIEFDDGPEPYTIIHRRRIPPFKRCVERVRSQKRPERDHSKNAANSNGL
jgi:hypothetical protein